MDTGLACYLAGYLDAVTLEKIDLLIIYNNTVYPIEIKKSANLGTGAIKNFNVINKFGLQIGNGGVICMKEDIFPINENNNYIPVELI